ncbi:MAG TPA: OmpA family protein [Chitinophagaceae bacterium]
MNGSFEDENICTEFEVNCSPEGWISTSDAYNNFYKAAGLAHSGNHCITIEAGHSKKLFRRTYIRSQLLCQLRKDKKYRIEFYIKSRHDILDSTGIYFTSYDFLFEKQVLYKIVPNVYVVNATVRPEKSDTNWQKVSIDYTANGKEIYLTLGNFSKNDITGSTGIPLVNEFFVFFDDISLVPEDPNEGICSNWQQTKDEIYDFHARHQFLDVYIKRHLDNPPDPPILERTSVQTIDTITIPDIFFGLNNSSLNAKSFHSLDSLAASMQHTQIDSLVVEGFADGTGTSIHNQELSEERAQAVANYLDQRLLLKKQFIVTRGWGSKRPVADNKTASGRQLNRRVEIFIYIRQ